MIRLTALEFCNKAGRRFIYEIPKKKKILFKYIFGTVEEEVSFAGGMILMAQREEIKAFLSHESDLGERMTLEVLYFKTEKGNVLREFKIPDKRMSISFQKKGTAEESADFAGTVFIKIISQELPFLKE